MRARPIFLVIALLAACAAARAGGLQPGEWEIRSTTTSPLFPDGQRATFKHCVTREDAQHPERWMARQSAKGPCRITPTERTEEAMTWDVHCPATNMRGSGEARITGPGTIESELHMAAELQGYRIRMDTRATARRIGPCKS